MRDARDLLERQARWQKGRKALSWPEKIRLVEGVRESARTWRATAAQPDDHRTSRSRED